MPDMELPASSTESEPELAKQLIVPKVEANTPPPPPLPSTPKRGYDDDDVTEGAQKEEENASPPRRFLDTKYGIREDGEQLMIGDYPVFVDPDDNITIKGTVFRGTERL